MGPSGKGQAWDEGNALHSLVGSERLQRTSCILNEALKEMIDFKRWLSWKTKPGDTAMRDSSSNSVELTAAGEEGHTSDVLRV